MKVTCLEIQNFRKLKSCRIDVAEQETIFVGANNSGKTSAMDCLISFFRDKKFTTQDFTLSNWDDINKIGNDYIGYSKEPNFDENKILLSAWQPFIPQLDIWIHVEENEIHYVNRIIPTLDWTGGLLGIRMRYEPKDILSLYTDYITAKSSAEQLVKDRKGKNSKLWPISLWDFLQKKLHTYFTVNAYILDPKKFGKDKDPQALSEDDVPVDFDPFQGLVKVDIINAQRGFSDPNSLETGIGNLSTQLREYYSKHLNPTESIDASDLDALDAIEQANIAFDTRLEVGFASSLNELRNLNYPGFGNPEISISTKVSPVDGLKHDSAVLFNIHKGETEEQSLKLSERHNGLGYQNLISMVFKLIRFRDEWMKVGKIAKNSAHEIEPLHIVLIEEPEAHLHAQVQQVFIRKAYGVLRHHHLLDKNKDFSTQLIISTHSSHIAHECNFKALRYFKRNTTQYKIPTSTVVNLSKTFGTEDETTKFAKRYLKTTHCDLFFADAAILIEGQAERMLLPFFVSQEFPKLSSSYISLLEICGSHAHRLKPLIEDLGIITLIITDIDSVDPNNNRKSVRPEKKKSFVTNNSTLKTWIPVKELIDDLVDLKSENKISKNEIIRVAYQYATQINFSGKSATVYSYTFEEALVFGNMDLFKSIKGDGLIKKYAEALGKPTIEECLTAMFEALKNAEKAKFALDLLFFIDDTNKLKSPLYISEGLQWLSETLEAKSTCHVPNSSKSEK
jgi:predicted ATP-dependent endonuclease of OLD family